MEEAPHRASAPKRIAFAAPLTPWLRSMRGERPQYQGVEPTLTTPERILVVMVVVAFVLFEVWFFFFSASPIDNRTGRTDETYPSVLAVEL